MSVNVVVVVVVVVVAAAAAIGIQKLVCDRRVLTQHQSVNLKYCICPLQEMHSFCFLFILC
jgi:hypothetical protein